MKKLFLLSLVAFAANVMAIEFITEEEVAARLGAQKAIEVSKHNVKALIIRGSSCDRSFNSKSARAYVVKKGYNATLVLTPSGLAGLTPCSKL